MAVALLAQCLEQRFTQSEVIETGLSGCGDRGLADRRSPESLTLRGGPDPLNDSRRAYEPEARPDQAAHQ